MHDTFYVLSTYKQLQASWHRELRQCNIISDHPRLPAIFTRTMAWLFNEEQYTKRYRDAFSDGVDFVYLNMEARAAMQLMTKIDTL